MKCCTSKKKALTQLKKAEGMLKKVILMLEEDKYCMDIIQQLMAVNGMIKGAEKIILENHLHTCFVDGLSGKKQTAMVEELIKVFNKVK